MVFHVCCVILGICTEISRELLPFPIPVGILYLWFNNIPAIELTVKLRQKRLLNKQKKNAKHLGLNLVWPLEVCR